MTDEEIIVEAKRRYPIGTVIMSAGGAGKTKITEHVFIWDGNLLRPQPCCGVYSRSGNPYAKGAKTNWAEIVKAVVPPEPVINNTYSIY